MIEIFPELKEHSDIYFTVPLRRFPCVDTLPRSIPITANANHIFLNFIRGNVVTVADLALRRVPTEIAVLDKLFYNSRGRKKWEARTLRIMMLQRPYSNESDARVAFIRRAFPIGCQNTTSTTSKKLGRSSTLLEPSNTAGEAAAPSIGKDKIVPNVSARTSINTQADALSVQSTPQVRTFTRMTRERFSINMKWTRQ
jgi:hypothetical protein